MEKNSLEFVETKSIFRKIIGTTLFLLAFIVVLSTPFTAAVFIFFGMLLVNERGFEFNHAEKKYRLRNMYLFFSFGKWKTYEAFEYITVFPVKETRMVKGIAAEANISNKVFKVNAFYNGNHKISVFKSTNKEEALTQGKMIADFLGIDLLDSTDKHNQKWVTQ